MDPPTTPPEATGGRDIDELSAIPMRMIDAWDRGDASKFAEAFTKTADFVAFEGTHLVGHDAIVAFHQPLFDTILKGSRLTGEVKFVRVLEPDWAVIHAWASTILPGTDVTSDSRNSMQLFVARKGIDGWRVVAMLNARQLTLERQQFLDDVDALPQESTERVLELVAAQLR